MLLLETIDILIQTNDKQQDECPYDLGRSRGGLTTKVHAVTGRTGRLLAFQLTVGQRGDAPLGEQLLEDFKCGEVGTVIAADAYDSDACLAAQVEGVHQAKCWTQKEKEIQQDGLPTPQSDRMILWQNQTLPPHRHPIRKKASKLRWLHLARCTRHRHDLNVRTTWAAVCDALCEYGPDRRLGEIDCSSSRCKQFTVNRCTTLQITRWLRVPARLRDIRSLSKF